MFSQTGGGGGVCKLDLWSCQCKYTEKLLTLSLERFLQNFSAEILRIGHTEVWPFQIAKRSSCYIEETVILIHLGVALRLDLEEPVLAGVP